MVEKPVLIDRVIAGHDTDWDGSNMVGTLTDDAQDADADLSNINQSDYLNEGWSQWDEREYVWEEAKGFVTAETTDEQIDAYLKKVRDEAPLGDIMLVGDARKDLIEMRDDLRDE